MAARKKKATAARKVSAKKTTGRRKVSAKKSASKKARSKARSKAKSKGEKFPELIYAIASPRSLGQVSLFAAGVAADASNVGAFTSDENTTHHAIHLLQEAGFEVLQATSLMINFCGRRQVYEEAFATSLELVEREVKVEGGVRMSTHIDCKDTDRNGLIDTESTHFNEVLEGVAIEEPYALCAATALAPIVDYWHLKMPGDVSLGLNADKAHRTGITGRDVKVAMVDTGFESHPYFRDRGYRVAPTVLGPGTANPDVDEHGHGTGEAANIFAAAPDVQLLPVKSATASGQLVNVTAAFNAAAALSPDILTNSWSSQAQNAPLSPAAQALAAAVAAAVADGITVVFSAGNGPSFGFPGQHPDVISVGGVFMHQDGSVEASDYATGYMSNVYPGRRVPDVSGLVGMMPKAAYIMLPIPAGCIIDEGSAGGTHPSGDETADDDGWAAFSGTSASAPQIAGVCALLKQACSRLTPAQHKDILKSTARDVTTGTNAMGNTATVGPDTATGHGLVDAARAVLIAKLRCQVVVPITPIEPFRPPFEPFRPPLIPFRPPVEPFRPPVAPFRPPVTPFRPPVTPFRPPLEPFRPPLTPFRPPLTPFRPPFTGRPQDADGSGALSAEDVAMLEQMIIDSDDFDEL